MADRRILRLIQEWLRAVEVEDGQWSETKQGTPQGGSSITTARQRSPHYVFDHMMSGVQ